MMNKTELYLPKPEDRSWSCYELFTLKSKGIFCTNNAGKFKLRREFLAAGAELRNRGRIVLLAGALYKNVFPLRFEPNHSTAGKNQAAGPKPADGSTILHILLRGWLND